MIIILAKRFIRQIFSDSMLAIACVAPVLAGLLFKIALPLFNARIAPLIGLPDLSPWWIIADLFLAVLCPFMICFSSSMVLLEERDEGVSAYLVITPAGKSGYLLSRLAVPALCAAGFSACVLIVCHLSDLSAVWIVCISLCMGSLSVVLALLIVAFSGNRVEGMAVSKISGMMLLGIPVPFFASGIERYLAGFLPSFWIAEAVRLSPSFSLAALPSLAVFVFIAGLWWLVLYPRFERKIAGPKG